MRIETGDTYPQFSKKHLSLTHPGSTSPYSDKPKRASAESVDRISEMSARMYDQLAPMPRQRAIDAASLNQGRFQPVAAQIRSPAKPAVMHEYAKGPVGFLQWLAAVHPDLYDGMRKNHPELLVQAHEITAQIEAGGGNSVAGLGDWMDSIGSWAASASGVITNLATAYGSVRTATARPQIQAQINQATAGQPPVNYGNPPATPPGGTVVTSPLGSGFGKTAMMVGVGALVVVGGLIMLKKK